MSVHVKAHSRKKPKKKRESSKLPALPAPLKSATGKRRRRGSPSPAQQKLW